jgi:hypothetical protein
VISFLVALGATLACLAGTIWSGIARRRQLHYVLVTLTFVLLAVTIQRAEAYGATLVFEGTALIFHRVHMISVTITLLMAPVLIWTGVRLARAPAAQAEATRARHRSMAVAFVVLIVVTAALGTVMTVLARPA